VSTTLCTEGPGIGRPSPGFRGFARAASVTDAARSLFPTSIATTTVDRVTGAA